MHACMHACTFVHHRVASAFACIARGGACHPFFFNSTFYLLDGIIYRKKNNEIRIIYHRGRYRAKFTFKLLHRYFPFRSLTIRPFARVRERDDTLSPFRYRSLVESAALFVSLANPEGVLAGAAGKIVEGMRFFLFRRVILCAFTSGPPKRLLLVCAQVRVPSYWHLPVSLPGTWLFPLFLLLSFAYFSIAYVTREIGRDFLFFQPKQ